MLFYHQLWISKTSFHRLHFEQFGALTPILRGSASNLKALLSADGVTASRLARDHITLTLARCHRQQHVALSLPPFHDCDEDRERVSIMESRASSRGVGGVAGAGRVRAKLESAMEAGKFYEAHQMYRTLYYR